MFYISSGIKLVAHSVSGHSVIAAGLRKIRLKLLGEQFDRSVDTSLVENRNLYDIVAQRPGNYSCERPFKNQSPTFGL